MGFKAGEGFIPTEYNWAKPSSWPELRQTTPEGAIGILISDKYPVFSFSVNCEGGYKVLVGQREYALFENGQQCVINIADLADFESILINYPEALTSYSLTLLPVNENADITGFKCERSQESGTQEQGVLWVHLATDCLMERFLLSDDNDTQKVRNRDLRAVTSSSGEIKVKSIYGAFNECGELSYLPVINYGNYLSKNYCSLRNCSKLSKVTLKNFTPQDTINMFYNSQALRRVIFENSNFGSLTNAFNIFGNCPNLDMAMLDLSSGDKLERITCAGTSQKPMTGFKGLKVSSAAPFTQSAPQIDVSYTGMEKENLKSLFESLPQVSAGQKINITGSSGSADLTQEDIAIAVNKGWEVLQ